MTLNLKVPPKIPCTAVMLSERVLEWKQKFSQAILIPAYRGLFDNLLPCGLLPFCHSSHIKRLPGARTTKEHKFSPGEKVSLETLAPHPKAKR